MAATLNINFIIIIELISTANVLVESISVIVLTVLKKVSLNFSEIFQARNVMRFYDTGYSGITSDCYQVCVYVTECGVWTCGLCSGC